jgi:hypothetical protein
MNGRSLEQARADALARAHMRSIGSRSNCFSPFSSPFRLRDHRSEPVQQARFSTTRSSSHSVAARGGCTTIPHSAGRAREDATILNYGGSGHTLCRFVHPDPPRLIRPRWKMMRVLCRQDQTAFRSAPSMTTPWVTYFQRATSNFLASATIVTFFIRPPRRRTRS